MNFTTFFNIVKTFPVSQAVYATGYHGIGKTTFMKKIADYFGLKLVIFNCSELADVADVIGIPTVETYIDKNGIEQKRMTWAAPFWYHPDEPVLLVFDEYPRARKEISNAIMQITLEHRLLDKKLPEGSRVFACGNPAGLGVYDANVIEQAKFSRYWVANITPTVKEWLGWFSENDGHKAIAEYIRKNSTDLDPFTNLSLTDANATAEQVLPDRRAWKMASDWLKSAEAELGTKKLPRSFVVDGMAGFVGDAVAVKFWPFYDNAEDQFGAEDILEDYDSKVGDEKVAALDTPTAVILINNIILWCQGMSDEQPTEKNKANFKKFFNALAPETQNAIARDSIQKSILSGEANNITMLTDDEMNDMFLTIASTAL